MNHLQISINKVEQWTRTWRMPVNVQKTQMIRFGGTKSTAQAISYTYSGANLEHTKLQKDLGVLIDINLTFTDHIEYIVTKAMRLCGWTMRVFHTRKPKVLLQVYKSIIRPTLEYASVIWNPTTKGQIRRVERVQRWYTKRLNGLTALTYSERLQVLQ